MLRLGQGQGQDWRQELWTQPRSSTLCTAGTQSLEPTPEPPRVYTGSELESRVRAALQPTHSKVKCGCLNYRTKCTPMALQTHILGWAFDLTVGTWVQWAHILDQNMWLIVGDVALLPIQLPAIVHTGRDTTQVLCNPLGKLGLPSKLLVLG